MGIPWMASPTSRPTPPPTHSAVLVVVPEAEQAVAQHRARWDGAAAWGVPAHVTVLYPFVDSRAARRVGPRAAGCGGKHRPAFDVAFRRTAGFGDDVLWLAPDPAGPFRDLTAAVVAAFADHPPYAGAFDGSTPHLTVGARRLGDVAALQRAERDCSASLPLQARVDRVHLFVGADAPDSWSVLHEVPLS